MIADLLIHITETLSPSERQSLETGLRSRRGVIAPRFGESTPHLLLVAYTTGATDSGALLTYVADQGYAARLVGL